MLKPDQKKIEEWTRSLDWASLKTHLDALTLGEDEQLVVLEALLKSDSMVRRRPGDDGKSRDQFVQDFRQYLDSKGMQDAVEAINQFTTTFHRIDKGYEAIYAAEAKLPFSALPPDKRIGAIFAGLSDAAQQLAQDREQALAALQVLGPNIQVRDAAGQLYNQDANIHGLTLAAGDSLQAEGYRNSYFNKGGQLVLPAKPCTATQTERESATAKLFNASCWRRWKHVDERVRLLGGVLEEFHHPNLPDWLNVLGPEGHGVKTTFEFQPGGSIDTFDLIATERFNSRMMQTFQEIATRTNVLDVVGAKNGQTVALPPKGAISIYEVHAGTLFGQFLSLPLDQVKAGGFLLSERLRGYGCLKQIVEESVEASGDYFPIMQASTLESKLSQGGLSDSAITSFLKTATFSRSSRDLFDQPLLRIGIDDYMVFGFAALTADLTKLMISSLENEKVNLQQRGPAFEDQILKLLRAQKLNPRNLKVKRGANEQFDYDVTFVWGDYVFFFECKNRGIPFGNPFAMKNFENDFHDHKEQVQRLRQALVDYPDILTKDYPEAVGKKQVFCVVFSLPFALGEQDGVYFIDESLLGRFFKEGGTFGVEVGRTRRGAPRVRVELGRIWKGKKPTPQDFMRYLKAPPQLKMAAGRYQQQGTVTPLSEEVALMEQDLVRKNLSDQEELELMRNALRPQGGR